MISEESSQKHSSFLVSPDIEAPKEMREEEKMQADKMQVCESEELESLTWPYESPSKVAEERRITNSQRNNLQRSLTPTRAMQERVEKYSVEGTFRKEESSNSFGSEWEGIVPEDSVVIRLVAESPKRVSTESGP